MALDIAVSLPNKKSDGSLLLSLMMMLLPVVVEEEDVVVVARCFLLESLLLFTDGVDFLRLPRGKAVGCCCC